MGVILINIKNRKEHAIKTVAEADEIMKRYPATFMKKETKGASAQAEKLIKETAKDATAAAKADKAKKKNEKKTAAANTTSNDDAAS